MHGRSCFMKPAFQIDGIDRRIIRELQRDASLSHAALAERVGASVSAGDGGAVVAISEGKSAH